MLSTAKKEKVAIPYPKGVLNDFFSFVHRTGYFRWIKDKKANVEFMTFYGFVGRR